MAQGRHRTESLTSPRRIRAVEKQQQAIELRMAGRTYAEIAKALHYANHAGAIAAVKKGLERTLQPAADEFRALTLERLTKVLQVHWPSMLQKDEKSSALVLSTIKDIRELLGLDAPVKGQGIAINLDNRQIIIEVSSEKAKELTARVLDGEGMPALEQGKDT